MTTEEIEKKLLAEPFNLELRLQYVQGLVAEEKFAEALVQIDLVLKQDASNVEILLIKVECLYETEQMEEAKKVYQEWDKKAVGSLRHASEWDKVFASPTLTVITGNFSENKASQTRRKSSSGVSFSDIVGMGELKEQLRLKIILPFQKPEIYAKFKKDAGGGVLLYGPPGCGKTMVAKAIATECNAEFISVGISDILGKYIGESEAHLAAFFQKARAQRPSILFFDELDALAMSRSSGSSSMRTLVNEFLQQLDGFGADNENILLLAASNRPWEVDPAMKRHGRFARHVFLPPPDVEARAKMFETKLAGLPCEILNCARLGQLTDLYSGADIDGIIDYAKEKALGRTFSSGKEEKMTEADLLEGIKKLPPTTNEWINTLTNLIKYGGGDSGYADVELYLKSRKAI